MIFTIQSWIWIEKTKLMFFLLRVMIRPSKGESMNTIEIKHKITGETLYTAIAKDGETLTVRSAIEMAVSDGANLSGADLCARAAL